MITLTRTLALPALASTLFLGACDQREAESPPPDGPLDLVGTTWQWTEFQDSADGEEAHHIQVPDPARYTLTLGLDGRAAILADCNHLSWTYALDGSRLTFDTVGPGTLAACGEESLDRRYLERLGHVVTYVMERGTLHLNLKMDGGNLVFTPAP
jgi:heat shock protein HslJ